jgi:hypothetical protein
LKVSEGKRIYRRGGEEEAQRAHRKESKEQKAA